MDREAIEFHDSVPGRVVVSGQQARLLFEPAYIHRSTGEPGLDAGTGWLADVEMVILGSAGGPSSLVLPVDVWDGTLCAGNREFQNVVPLPFEGHGEVRLALELNNGAVVEITGESVQLRVVGEYRFVEDVPAG